MIMAAHLLLEKLTKNYAGTALPALDDASLTVEAGKVMAIVGPSGSGKSTLLKIIAGLVKPDRGRVMVDGADITSIPPERRGVAMMVQDNLLFPHMNVADNIAFGLRMRKVAPAERQQEVRRMLALVRLEGFEKRRPETLSAGQAQRVALARALVIRPKVLLLDEPFSNLDPTLRIEMREEIRTMQRSVHTTMLFVTHDREEALMMGDHIALIDRGQIIESGTAQRLFEQPRTREAARFFGAANLMSGTIAQGIFQTAFGSLTLASSHGDGPATLMIRPEMIELGGSENTITATIEALAYRGSHILLHARAGDNLFTIHARPHACSHLQAGQKVTLSLPAERIWIIP